MLVTVFAKKKKTQDGKSFTTYVARLKKIDGSELSCGVKFREEAGNPNPADCPMNIEVDKCFANLNSKEYIVEDTGEVKLAHTLWISEWKKSEIPYEDHSLDDFE